MKTELIRKVFISTILLATFTGLGATLVITTYELTKEQIKMSEQANLLKNLNTIIPKQNYDNDLLKQQLIVPNSSQLGNKGPTIIYQAWKNNKPVALAFAITAHEGYNGDIKILIAINYNGQISGVRVISHQETPGLGDKIDIAKNDWILGFNGKKLVSNQASQWKVKKDGGVFDQFSGATITPRTVVNTVYKALDYFNHNHEKLFLQQSQYDKLNQPAKKQSKVK